MKELLTWLTGETVEEIIDDVDLAAIKKRPDFAGWTFRWCDDFKNLPRMRRKGYEVFTLPLADLHKRGQRIFRQAGSGHLLIARKSKS